MKQDPNDVSAQSLLLITHALLSISNNTQTSGSLSSLAGSQNFKFSPSSAALCVNVLWFLSLSISVAVSLIAMLAKEWCYSFMHGRTGHPRLQARRRQQHWDGLVRWRMQELLVLLPSLIHLALCEFTSSLLVFRLMDVLVVLFAVGLSIYLWSLRYGVAVPVVFVMTISLGFYTASMILPLVYEFCPYATALSKLIQKGYESIYKAKRPPADENPKQDLVTSRALSWLIKNCEVPRSVDVALQAIAGAHHDLPREALKECNAALLVCRRLATSHLCAGNYELVTALYTRALVFLRATRERTRLGSATYRSVSSMDLDVMV